MSAIKKIIICLILITLVVVPSLASGVRYSTDIVETGVFEITTTEQASIKYLRTESVSVFDANAVLNSIEVSKGDYVSAGDTLITYTLVVSDVELKQAEVDLSNAVYDRDYEIDKRYSEIDEFRQLALSETDPRLARMYKLKADRAEITLASFTEESLLDIAKYEAAYNDKLNKLEVHSVKASISGIVADITQQSLGSSIQQYKQIAYVYDPTAVLVRFNNESGNFMYGMSAKVTLSGRGSNAVYQGSVVSSDNVLPAALRGNGAYVIFDSTKMSGDIMSVSVSGITARAENAMYATSRAVTFKNGRYSVNILDSDGTVRTRYVVKAAENLSDMWLTLGVKESDKLITK